MTFKIKICVALKTETSGGVMNQCNRILKYNIKAVFVHKECGDP
jgi:hypothetical protein